MISCVLELKATPQSKDARTSVTVTWGQSGAVPSAEGVWSEDIGRRKSGELNNTDDRYEGFTPAQFLTALRMASRPIAEKAEAAKAKGMIGKEEALRRMRKALNADS
ncbi:hypothetical protein BH11ARM2_BH11ARM2_39360 [soil metagenome]